MRRSRLIRLREGLGLTQRQVANAVGITESYYGMIEAGVRTPRFELGLRVAEVLGGDPQFIFFEPKANETLAQWPRVSPPELRGA